MKKKIYRLEHWSYVTAHQHNGNSGLCGGVHGHPKFPDDKTIVTSPIEEYDAEEDAFITRSGSRYKLGDIDPEYNEMYPGAKERLIMAIRHKKRSETMHAENTLSIKKEPPKKNATEDDVADWLKDDDSPMELMDDDDDDKHVGGQ